MSFAVAAVLVFASSSLAVEKASLSSLARLEDHTILRGTPLEVRAALPHDVGAPRLTETTAESCSA